MLPPILADMNIAVPVVEFLRNSGVDIISAREKGWCNFTDSELLAKVFSAKRYILTHDSDFGMLAIFRKEPVVSGRRLQGAYSPVWNRRN